MQAYQSQFIELCLHHDVLRFGEFTLKSGRISPYFFNAGLFNSGSALAQLGELYAQAIENAKLQYDVIFGPAYKGIPLACTTAIALTQKFGHDAAYCFNRKEAKDHGEGGSLVGAALTGNILIIDDVITAGTAIRESLQLIKANQANLAGIVIALDRQEKGRQERSAIQEIEHETGVPVISIITLDDLINFLMEQPDKHDVVEKMQAYRARYGVNQS